MYLGGNRRWVPLVDRDNFCIMKSNKTEKNCLEYIYFLNFLQIQKHA